MKLASLSTDQAPPIFIPLRFFAVAPLFMILAALLLATSNGNPFSDIHSPALLAATHCITLGFVAMTMLGAIQQILPVMIGSTMPAPAPVAWLTLLSLTLGTLLLSSGFMLGKAELLNLAWPLLGLTFLVFIGASLVSLTRAAARNVTKAAVLLALFALTGAITLGALLARGYATGLALDYLRLAAAHISLALGGWVMLLIVGVSYQVVPMFQITPPYPKRLTETLAPAIFAVLLINLAILLLEPASRWPGFIAESLFWLLSGCFAVVTLRLQNQRKRRIADATLSFFQLGMFSLLLAALFSLASFIPSTAFAQPRLLSAIAFLLGFAMSLIQGMLYKIIPFLVWFHLFRGGPSATKVGIPNVKEVIPERWMWRHLWLHGATILAALLASGWDAAVWLLALGLLLQGLLLGYAVFTGIAVYRRTLRKIEQASR
ncbi:MAG: hypothetical protein K2P67_02140 [Gallionellaceae bacterium]|jgi:hypothetical protein|nr:hypothetical protein [Gallionellaceae bacterium]